MILVLALALLAAAALAAPDSYDIVIANGTLIDGSGAPGRRADLGIRAGRIAADGDLRSAPRRRTIDASGLAVAPGFIDMHNHSDDSLVAEPKCESMIRQGVTTMILGEGGSAGPVKPGVKPWTTLGGYLDYVAQKKVATNVCSYVGQTQIWTYVKGDALTAATPAEMEAMKREVDKAMREGALGLSTSLLMPPSSLVTTPQLVELAKVACGYGGLYSTHIRDEGAGVFRSVAEAIEIGKAAGIRVDILHIKIADRQLWGRMDEVVAMIAKARAEGYDIRANVYPYTAGQNDLRAIIPPWAHDGGNAKMLERLRDPAMRARMRRDILNGIPGWYNHYLAIGNWDGMQLVSLGGRRMSDVIRERGGDPVNVLFDLLLEQSGSVPTVYFHHTEQDMQLALRQPFTSVGSDGLAMSPEGPLGATRPHPRSYGTFPRVLGRYVRELNVLTLPEAVRKMTSMNAEKAGIAERGLLKPGYWADVTVFDPATVADKATYVNPHQYAAGIPYVIVNGAIVLDNGRRTGALPGKVLRGPAYQPSRPAHRPAK
ncbi:MAG: N-acyl-D-amino-acid deacylase family protein [Acidobacteriota bacterium]